MLLSRHMCNVHTLRKIGFSKKPNPKPCRKLVQLCDVSRLLTRQKAADVRCTLLALAAAAERRGRDYAGCACGAKGRESYLQKQTAGFSSVCLMCRS